MKKIKLDPFSVALIVIAVFVVLLFLGTFLDSAKSRIAELEQQISRDLKLLKLTRKRQEELARKAVQAYRIVVSITFFVFLSLIFIAVLAGFSYQNALEIQVGTSGIFVAMITVIFYNTWNPDILLKVLRDKIRVWIYQRNGFDILTIESIEARLRNNRFELNNLSVSKTKADLIFKIKF